MSSPAALATVTATLQHLLSNAAPGATVTTRPPSTARSGASGPQINLFLYSTHFDPALRNTPLPGTARQGESAYPPLPLVLKYLITCYGQDDDDISGQQLLGQAMSLFHDHPVLSRSDIQGIAPDSGLHQQIERIRITPEVLSLDDMSKLWTSFQTEYRLSITYEISVVLIESRRTARTPLPVLRRGEEDRGGNVLAGPSPFLSGMRFHNQKPAAELGDVVTLLGSRLNAEPVSIRLQHPSLAQPQILEPLAGPTETEMQFHLPGPAEDPEAGAKWPAGFYALTLVISRPDVPTWTSNALSMPLAPTIRSVNPLSAPASTVVLTIECLPQIKTGQRVALLFGDRIIQPDSVTTPADPAAVTMLVFTVENAEARPTPYVLRLRIDGVDSIPVDFSGDTPQFAADQTVTIT